MKINYFAIYMLLIGWAGAFLALGMPLLLSIYPDLALQSHFYQVLWITGGAVSVVAGAYILWDNRNNYGQVAGIFLVLGIGSLLYDLIDHLAA